MCGHMSGFPWCRGCHLCWTKRDLHVQEWLQVGVFLFFLLCCLLRGSGCMSFDLPEEGELPRWVHILWRLYRIQVTKLQTEVLKFPQNPQVWVDNLLFSVYSTSAFTVRGLKIVSGTVKWSFSILTPGWSHPRTNTQTKGLIFYSQKLACRKFNIQMHFSMTFSISVVKYNVLPVSHCSDTCEYCGSKMSSELCTSYSLRSSTCQKPHPSPTNYTNITGRCASLLLIKSTQMTS